MGHTFLPLPLTFLTREVKIAQAGQDRRSQLSILIVFTRRLFQLLQSRSLL